MNVEHTNCQLPNNHDIRSCFCERCKLVMRVRGWISTIHKAGALTAFNTGGSQGNCGVGACRQPRAVL